MNPLSPSIATNGGPLVAVHLKVWPDRLFVARVGCHRRPMGNVSTAEKLAGYVSANGLEVAAARRRRVRAIGFQSRLREATTGTKVARIQSGEPKHQRNKDCSDARLAKRALDEETSLGVEHTGLHSIPVVLRMKEGDEPFLLLTVPPGNRPKQDRLCTFFHDFLEICGLRDRLMREYSDRIHSPRLYVESTLR